MSTFSSHLKKSTEKKHKTIQFHAEIANFLQNLWLDDSKCATYFAYLECSELEQKLRFGERKLSKWASRLAVLLSDKQSSFKTCSDCYEWYDLWKGEVNSIKASLTHINKVRQSYRSTNEEINYQTGHKNMKSKKRNFKRRKREKISVSQMNQDKVNQTENMDIKSAFTSDVDENCDDYIYYEKLPQNEHPFSGQTYQAEQMIDPKLSEVDENCNDYIYYEKLIGQQLPDVDTSIAMEVFVEEFKTICSLPCSYPLPQPAGPLPAGVEIMQEKEKSLENAQRVECCTETVPVPSYSDVSNQDISPTQVLETKQKPQPVDCCTETNPVPSSSDVSSQEIFLAPGLESKQELQKSELLSKQSENGCVVA